MYFFVVNKTFQCGKGRFFFDIRFLPLYFYLNNTLCVSQKTGCNDVLKVRMAQKSFAEDSSARNGWKIICGRFLREECFKNHLLGIPPRGMFQKSFAENSSARNGWKIIFWKFFRKEWLKNHLLEILSERIIQKTFAEQKSRFFKIPYTFKYIYKGRGLAPRPPFPELVEGHPPT